MFENEGLSINLINVTTIGTTVMKMDDDRDLGYYEVNFIHSSFSNYELGFEVFVRPTDISNFINCIFSQITSHLKQQNALLHQ